MQLDLKAILDLFSAVAIVSGLIFAGVELRQYRQLRERDTALHLYKTFQTPEMVRARRIVFHIPDGLSKKEIVERVGERLEDVYYMIQSMEGMGTLVMKREFRLQMVEDFFSGLVLISWKKLQRFIEDEREEMGRQTIGEWFQWMAERIKEREDSTAAIPGYIEYKNWKEK